MFCLLALAISVAAQDQVILYPTGTPTIGLDDVLTFAWDIPWQTIFVLVGCIDDQEELELGSDRWS